MPAIRVGLIGASPEPARSWGTRAHIPAIGVLPDVELAAICTSRPETARVAAEHFGVTRAFSDIDSLAACPDVDLVVVSVKAPLHEACVAAAVRHRKHVYCEWPLGLTTAEPRRSAEAARSAGVRTIIGLQGYHNAALRHARDLIAQGYLGRVEAVTLKVSQELFGRQVVDEQVYTADVASATNLLDVATAQSLMALCATVGPFRSLSATATVLHDRAEVIGTGRTVRKTAPDQVLIDGVLESGAVASIHMRAGSSPRSSGVRLEINGVEGDLLATSAGPANLHRAELALSGGSGVQREMRSLTIPDRYSNLGRADLPFGPATYVLESYREMVAAIRHGAPIAADFEFAVRWHELVDTIRRAAETGHRQSVTSG